MRNLYIYRLVFVSLVGLISSAAFGQSTSENYVKAKTYQFPDVDDTTDDDQKIITVSYYDGLGRPKQNISVKAGGKSQNIYQFFQYDPLGLQAREHLPYATNSELIGGTQFDLMPMNDLRNGIYNFYEAPKYDTRIPYSEASYEIAPSPKILEQAAPGENWELDVDSDLDNTIKYDYGVNITDDVLSYEAVITDYTTYIPELALRAARYYRTEDLSLTIIKDENWEPADGNNRTVHTFTNRLGQVVLKRHFESSDPHDIYYVYDQYGNLSFVIPPTAADEIIGTQGTLADPTVVADRLDKYAYQYRYDHKNRLVESKLPGADWDYTVYDHQDRPILSQTAQMRSSNEWLFTKFDVFGRPAYTGLYTSSLTRVGLQSVVNAHPSASHYETQTTTSNPAGDTNIFYTSSNAFPTSGYQVLTINYYDTYVDVPTSEITIPTAVYGADIKSAPKGQATVSKVRVLGTNHWITSVNGYDIKNRVVFSASHNPYLDTNDETHLNLDFSGKTLTSYTSHTKAAASPIKSFDYFTYDHQGRLLTHMQNYQDSGLELIADNTYDELGRLIVKKVGGELFASGYTDLVNVLITPEGNIEKDDSSSTWNAGIATIGKIIDDGGISFTAIDTGEVYMVGLNDVNKTYSYGDLDYAFWVRAPSGNPKFRIRIKGVDVTGDIDYSLNDHFAIERVGDEIRFLHNGAIIHTKGTGGNNPPLLGDASFKTPGAKVSGLSFYALNIDKTLQELDYRYNIRGWLNAVNPLDDMAGIKNTDLFGYELNYTTDEVEGDVLTGGLVDGLYNGNIAQAIWMSSKDDNKRAYGYKYDALNRITDAHFREGSTLSLIPLSGQHDNDVYGITYDKMGNILTLKRNGRNSGSSATTVWDDLDYFYDGNQLTKVVEKANGGEGNQHGFIDGFGGIDFDYDSSGNMTKDENKGITAITYNHLNLPETVSIDNTFPSHINEGTITYVYDATGVKMAKSVLDITTGITNTTEYTLGGVYQDGDHEFTPQPEGYIYPYLKDGQTRYRYAFQYTDHLGNVRLSYEDTNGDGAVSTSEIIEENHYYPFGLKHAGYNNTFVGGNDVAQNWKFGGKEYNQELGLDWYDITARNYDPAIGRWMNVDPLADQMRRHSPYNYAFDNPIYFMDPDGTAPISAAAINNNNAKNSQRLILDAEAAQSAFENKKELSGLSSFLDKDKKKTEKDAERHKVPESEGGCEDPGVNCHSYAFHNRQGDPSDPRNDSRKPFVDNYPDDDIEERIKNGTLKMLDFNEDNQVGDIVVYYWLSITFPGGNINIDVVPVHSGIVSEVDEEGFATRVISKMGEDPTYSHHPRDLGEYSTLGPQGDEIFVLPKNFDNLGNKEEVRFKQRVYFRPINE